MNAVLIDEELKVFLEGPVSVLVATRDADMNPEVTRAWGPRVTEDRMSIIVCVPRETSYRTLDNLKSNGAVAVIFASPTNYRGYQVKGMYVDDGTASPLDLASVDAHREAFARANETLGLQRTMIEALWKRELEAGPELVRVQLTIEQIFDQTPGARAGTSL